MTSKPNLKYLVIIAVLALAPYTLLQGGCGKKELEITCPAKQNQYTSGSEYGIKDTVAGGDELGQTFKVTEKTTVNTVQVYLKKVGTISATETLTAEIWDQTAGGLPNTLLTSGSVALSAITTTGGYVSITVTSKELTAGSSYWLRLRASYSASNSNYVKWFKTSGTLDAYTDGQAYAETSTVNNFLSLGNNQDFTFRIGSCIQ